MCLCEKSADWMGIYGNACLELDKALWCLIDPVVTLAISTYLSTE
jgi:hypothetical protein